MDFVLNHLPRSDYDIFVDASTSWGIGGCCGTYFFAMSWTELRYVGLKPVIIARMELLAGLIAMLCFGNLIKRKLVRLYIDNDNAYHWLRKSRSSSLEGTKFLALWELWKYKLMCKVSPIWIPSAHNVTADTLSRGRIPTWLQRRGRRRRLTRKHICILRACPIKTWLTVLKL